MWNPIIYVLLFIIGAFLMINALRKDQRLSDNFLMSLIAGMAGGGLIFVAMEIGQSKDPFFTFSRIAIALSFIGFAMWIVTLSFSKKNKKKKNK